MAFKDVYHLVLSWHLQPSGSRHYGVTLHHEMSDYLQTGSNLGLMKMQSFTKVRQVAPRALGEPYLDKPARLKMVANGQIVKSDIRTQIVER